MTIFSVITLLGGLAFFLYGMHVMSASLSKLAGSKLEWVLKKMTSHPLKSMLLGAGITIAIQSSSAMTVMLVGLVNSGIMTLSQTVAIIMGSNIGTTLTAWLLSLAGIEGDNFFLQLLKPENFSLLFALVGILMILASKKQKRRDIGSILVGFAILMYGMKLMSGAMSPLGEMPEFASLMTAFNNPILGVLVGTVFTGIIQSSAASVGILQSLSMTGAVTVGMALPIIMGQNIGTCVTAIISSIGVNKNAKRVAAVHISFNIIGTIVCLILFYGLNAVFRFAIVDDLINPVGVAFCHSIFNLFTTAILLPFQKQLVSLAKLLVRDQKGDDKYSFLDVRLLNTPSIAVAESNNMTVEMAKLSRETILSAMKLLDGHSEKDADAVLAQEQTLDAYEDKLGSYLVKLAGKALTDSDSRSVSRMLHCIGNFERIGDHAVNIVGTAREIHDKQLAFSPEALSDLSLLRSALEEILRITAEAFEKNSAEIASSVEPLEQVIDRLSEQVRMRHIERLQSGTCTIEMGFVLADLLADIERVSDHCSNVAVCIIELSHDGMSTHEYLKSVKSGNDERFISQFNAYAERFSIRGD